MLTDTSDYADSAENGSENLGSSEDASSKSTKGNEETGNLLFGCGCFSFVIIVIVAFSFSIYDRYLKTPRVLIETLPSGATAFLDGESIGTTPFYAEISVGEKRLKFERTDYEIFEKIEIVDRETNVLRYPLIPISNTQSQIDSVAVRLQRISDAVAELEKKADPLIEKTSKSDANTSKELDQLKNELQELKTTLLANPDASLALPMLRVDLENIRAESGKIELKIDRVYDLGKWFVGTLVTIMIALIGYIHYLVNQSRHRT